LEAHCAVGYDQLGLDQATGGDEVFRQLVLARIIQPTSKQDIEPFRVTVVDSV
jgi:hypothetical protein